MIDSLKKMLFSCFLRRSVTSIRSARNQIFIVKYCLHNTYIEFNEEGGGERCFLV